MKKPVFWLLLAALCLFSLAPAWAAEGAPLPQERELTQWEMDCLALPNSRPDRLDRYAAWAAKYPEAALETVVAQVNLDQDRTVYQDVQAAADPDSTAVLVNKHYSLAQDYAPELEALGWPYGSGSLRPEAARAFRAI